jgi:hypothetical protein
MAGIFLAMAGVSDIARVGCCVARPAAWYSFFYAVRTGIFMHRSDTGVESELDLDLVPQALLMDIEIWTLLFSCIGL